MIISFSIGRYRCGIFPYWLGFSRRSLGSQQVIDVGFFKAMWATPNKASTRLFQAVVKSPPMSINPKVTSPQ